jgi:hypothetical protein
MAIQDIICLISVSILICLGIYICYVTKIFTKEYKKEIEYYEMLKKNVEKIKLKSDDYDIDEVIEVLRKENFSSNMHMKF